mgnify:CR=1 FL=1
MNSSSFAEYDHFQVIRHKTCIFLFFLKFYFFDSYNIS